MASRDTAEPRASANVAVAADTSPFVLENGKIMLRKILRAAADANDGSGGIAEIYRRDVVADRTRTVRLVGIKCEAAIIQTLLGYEVKARHKRIQCPDLVTARYLKLFSEIGCHSIKLPYDPTATARLVPVLESTQQRIKKIVKQIFPNNAGRRKYAVRKIYAIIREELRELS